MTVFPVIHVLPQNLQTVSFVILSGLPIGWVKLDPPLAAGAMGEDEGHSPL